MDLSKKTLIGTIVSLFLIAVTSAVAIFIQVAKSNLSEKTLEVFLLIFSLIAIAGVVVTAIIMYREMMIERIQVIILSGIFVIALFSMITASIDIDALNGNSSIYTLNAYGSELTSNGKAFCVLPAISGILQIPAMVGAGYLLAQ